MSVALAPRSLVDTPGLEFGGLEVLINGVPYLKLEHGVCAGCARPADYRRPMYVARGALGVCVLCRPMAKLRAQA